MLTSLTDPLPRQSWAAVCRPASAWCPPAATPAAPSAPPTPWPCSARRGRGRSRWGPRAAGHIISILLVVRSPRTRGGWCRWCSGCGRSSRPWRPSGPSWRCPGTTSSKVDTAQRSIVYPSSASTWQTDPWHWRWGWTADCTCQTNPYRSDSFQLFPNIFL